jgi:hypothetical protein
MSPIVTWKRILLWKQPLPWTQPLLCLMCAACLSAAGCAPMAVPVVKQSLSCDVAAELLQTCSDAAPIKDGVTFGEMINVSSRDRLTLKQCAQAHKDLAAAVARCKESVDRHNASIRADEVPK